jgi:xanthine/CO dehydrogenase XdhC/CoxF family maturation factor
MKELQDICNLYSKSKRAGRKMMLASVVRISGSAYRRAGAHMLVTEDGFCAGSISAGCLESDVLERFDQIDNSEIPILLEYTANDINDEFGMGLGCDGAIQVLLEMIGRKAHFSVPGTNLIDIIDRVCQERNAVAVATIISVYSRHYNSFDTPETYCASTFENLIGNRLAVFDSGETVVQNVSPSAQFNAMQDWLETKCKKALRSRTASEEQLAIDGTLAIHEPANGKYVIEVCIEVIQPPTQLLIFGGGEDAVPLVEMAHTLGMSVHIIDRRDKFASQTRFPYAASTVHSLPEMKTVNVLADECTAAIIMNHNYEIDKATLSKLVDSRYFYVGVLGPKRRTQRMLSELVESGVNIPQTLGERLYFPAGIDLGAETCEEIALSILSEIKAVFKGRCGGLLRDKQRAIHAGLDEETKDISTCHMEEGRIYDGYTRHENSTENKSQEFAGKGTSAGSFNCDRSRTPGQARVERAIACGR